MLPFNDRLQHLLLRRSQPRLRATGSGGLALRRPGARLPTSSRHGGGCWQSRGGLAGSLECSRGWERLYRSFSCGLE
jgi:hypothetical protein